MKASADLELLTKQLNQFKPASGSDVGNLRENLTQEVAEKLSASDRKVEELSTALEGQKKDIQIILAC